MDHHLNGQAPDYGPGPADDVPTGPGRWEFVPPDRARPTEPARQSPPAVGLSLTAAATDG